MSLARTLRLAVVPGVRFETLPLDPQAFFVLSRIEGRPTVAEILGMSALSAAQTEAILERLLELGALQRVEEPMPSRPRVRQSTQELRAQAQDRRRRMLTQQLGQARSSQPTPPQGTTAPSPRPAQPTPVPSVPSSSGAPAPGSPDPGSPDPDDPRLEPVLALVGEADPRLDPSLGLAVDKQRLLLALEDGRDELTPFQILGIHPTHDLKEIRSAFREASRRFHPDAHHGRELGRFREPLSRLFAEAKTAYQTLQSEEARAPLVDALEQEHQRRRRVRQQREAARQAAEELRRRREQEQLEQRRAARDAQRVQRERDRLATAAQGKVAEYLQAAADAENMDNFARAANNYRLALQVSPHDEEIRRRWEEARSIARRRRAKDAFARACTYVEVGHHNEAVPLFLEAAEADPTLEHLAHAADSVRQQDPAKARDLAIEALRKLTENERGPAPLRPGVVADLRLMIARAFLAAGQGESARQQVLLVQRVRPKDPEARALLKTLKVT
ncbi:MAG: J domain-containing protein [Myxococcales bacterium]|nr:J domain-containing protein [Myxococcales bacterium]MCB9712464.1 J domain-containing protein [Myxococcales bacterium]